MKKKTWTRRAFLEASAIAVSALAADLPSASEEEPRIVVAQGFSPVLLKGNITFDELAGAGLSEVLSKAIPEAPRGSCVSWGIPFQIDRPLLLNGKPVTEETQKLKAEWIVFQHTSDVKPIEEDAHGFIRPMRGEGSLGEHVADYVIVYADSTEARQAIRRRHQVGMLERRWGENCFQAVAHMKPCTVRPFHEQPSILVSSRAEMRVRQPDFGSWINWLWAWQNPHPEKEISALRFEPIAGAIIISGVTAGNASSEPLRWQTRQKAILKMPEGMAFDYDIDSTGSWKQIQFDMGQVISVEPRLVYSNADWKNTYNNQMPEKPGREVLVEYSAHPDARFHLWDGTTIPVAALKEIDSGLITRVASARRVRIRTIDKASGKPVPVKLHVHGESSEYLAPIDRHRQANTSWFGDYAPEYRPGSLYEAKPGKGVSWSHRCTYIGGETIMDLPVGNIYVEVSKGFEVKPVRTTFHVGPETERIDITLDKVLHWREKGWVTADTHVHFLSPGTARLEGSAEGVNVVNLLASQWGELMTNVGDFDGKTTFGSKEAGGDGEWLVRVGTENRQHVLGHISLLGYEGDIIAPMCSGGPYEAAIGDPVGVLLMEWAEQCRRQNGIVILPHFPDPRCEHAAELIEGLADAVEMPWQGNLLVGIDPYSLSDWYRYLNLGYFIPVVGGTDKMSAELAVGDIRTYAKIPEDREFTYESWKSAIRDGDTFVTYGPLIEFAVDGKKPGSKIDLRTGGGRVAVTWQVASVVVPMSKVELIVNGEVRESRSINPEQDAGHWSVMIDRSSWVAVMVRAHYEGKPEIIAAHSSPVMIQVAGSEFFSATDAVTILDQIEGALAYIDTVGTRAQDDAYKRMRMKLTAAYRKLHNQLHQQGHYHEHSVKTDHA